MTVTCEQAIACKVSVQIRPVGGAARIHGSGHSSSTHDQQSAGPQSSTLFLLTQFCCFSFADTSYLRFVQRITRVRAQGRMAASTPVKAAVGPLRSHIPPEGTPTSQQGAAPGEAPLQDASVRLA